MKEIQITTENKTILKLVKKIEKFKEFSEQELHDFLKAGKLREYQPNEIIIKEGNAECWLYFLINGVLTVKKKGHKISTLRRCGDMFGEMGVIDGSPRSASVLAHSKSLLIGFDGSVIDQKFKSNQLNFCYIIYRVFAEVLAVRLRETTELSVELEKENRILQNKLNLAKSYPSNAPKDSELSHLELLTNKKILIIDGVEATRKILRSLLRELQFKEIFQAVDGEHALQTLKTNKIDMIIADSDLPTMSGLDLLTKIRAIPALKDIPFVLIINKLDMAKAGSAIDEDASQYLIKPYNANTLYEKISNIEHG